MNVNNTAKLIEVKNKTLRIEAELEERLRKIGKKSKIDFERCNDYGRRTFNLTIAFDQINMEAFSDENIAKIKELYVEFVKLRKQVKPLETNYDIQTRVQKDMKNKMREML